MSYRQIATHYEGCESTHHDCALARLEEARNELTAERQRAERVEAELAAVKEDAARYRYLRGHAWVDPLTEPDLEIHFGPGYLQTLPDLLDERIDAARKS